MTARALKVSLARRPRALGVSTRCPAVRLDASTPADVNAPARWVQVAYAGVFKGHSSGEFAFTEQTFAQLITNFRAHPSYRAGAPDATPGDVDAGAFDVIQWDFHHASEQPSTSGTIPVDGAPAQGWALELEMRAADDGNAQLWAFTRFLEPLRSYVREGKYKWSSVTVYFDAHDPTTGQSIGPYLSSIAATNDPFLQGMVPLAARRSPGVAASYVYDSYCPPQTPEEVLNALRELFELSPTADLGAVLAELAKLRAWSTGGAAAPLGVDVGCIVGSLRRIFNLPTLSSAEDVFGAAEQLLSALAESAAAAAGAAPGAAPAAATTTTAPAASAAATRNKDMEIIKILAARLGIPADEAAVQKAIVVRLEKGEGAMSGLQAILSALGVEDVSGATSKIAQMFKSVDALERAMPELAALREGEAKGEDEDASEDVESAMATYRMPAPSKPALVAMRTGGVALTAGATDLVARLAARAAARAAFLAAYPPVDPAKRQLLAPAFGSGSGAPPLRQLSAAHGGGDTQLQAQAITLGGAPVIDLSAYHGNATERALAWVEANEPQSKTMTREQKFYRARTVLTQARAMGQPV